MKIHTKYNIGNIVHFLHSNRVELREIIRIHIFITDEISIYYMFKNSGSTLELRIEEDKVFNTKEELIKSL